MTWDAVHDSRRAFLACMHAQSAPGTAAGPLPAPGISPDADLDSACAILLALLDVGLTLAVAGDETAHHVAAAVCRSTGAELGAMADADFVLTRGDVAGAVALARRGSRLAPELGATVVAVTGADRSTVRMSGPGIARETSVVVPLPGSAVDSFVTANSGYPCGVDVLVVNGRTVTALPRSVQILSVAG